MSNLPGHMYMSGLLVLFMDRMVSNCPPGNKPNRGIVPQNTISGNRRFAV